MPTSPEVTLLLNGKIIGKRNLADADRGIMRWEIPYVPGTLAAVGSSDGQDVCRCELQTAGPPARIALLPDQTQLHADTKDICHLEFQVVDAQGIRVPDAAPEVTFALTGPAKILGIGNGDNFSVEDCKTNTHATYQGHGLAILQATDTPGAITTKATGNPRPRASHQPA